MSHSDGPGRMPSWADILSFAQHAEAVGLDSLWICDHLISSSGEGSAEGIHEGWTTMAALAATTSRAELGNLVSCVAFRSPALLAKMATTVDMISGGRLVLGLGAGWDDAEHAAFGYPIDHRIERLQEALEIIGPLLRGESVTFAGRYHEVSRARLLPRPDRQIPVLVAANQPKMLQLTARRASAWNTAWYGVPDERLRTTLAQLNAALAAEGREPGSLRRTVGMRVRVDQRPGVGPSDREVGQSAEELACAVSAYEELGIDDLIVGLEPMSIRSLDRLAEARELRASRHS
jgi:alkanesulfonate monooxygenase SsuD/methylene tetrahydromethanopterin reductase-like flavin-dependent oxidoreductase (luciferase family)